ncbi:MAG: glutamate--tRNA ligase [Bacteroidetes bacterium]|nr:MAG: glutamate--tRNA ligase [Bacteroidota bacterium]RLD93422.1 MAG: glutamate--tRNA ligase [Bacteroidota bacterium]
MNQNIRVRFAPSPTGPLHIGGLRTALFNYLFARKNGGVFILRIEDTDQTRYVEGAEDYIKGALDWCGLTPDEGPGQGGGFGPYRQSERKDQYQRYAMQLLESGHAYYAFDTPEELDSMRKEYEARGETFVYDARVRESLKNSLTMQAPEVEEKIASGTPYVIRFRFEPNKEIVMQDMVRGEVVFSTSTLDDKILFKSDGMPTYHLANVVDDNLMAISHVIRGEEWLPSLPLHVSLYSAFGWEHLMPKFAHLPLILKPTGKGKLSKRDGEKGGFPVFPLEWKDPISGEISPGYREEGYLPEGCINMLALLGWNPGTEQELFSLDELIKEFQLEKVGRSGSRFDPEKTLWFNHQHIQLMTDKKLIPAFQSVLKAHNVNIDDNRLALLVPIIKPRIDFFHEVWEESWIFFQAPDAYDPDVVKKRWKEDTPGKMELLAESLEKCEPFTAESIELQVKQVITSNEWGMGAIMNAWRLLLVGAAKGPGLFDLAAFLGKDEVIKRMKTGINEIKR